MDSPKRSETGPKEVSNSRKAAISAGPIFNIDPREAVPEVSKSKGYINQEKMCL